MSGCVTYGNKGIDYLTEEEISKAVNKIENAKERLEDKLSDRQNLKEFTIEILDAVQNSFEYE